MKKTLLLTVLLPFAACTGGNDDPAPVEPATAVVGTYQGQHTQNASSMAATCSVEKTGTGQVTLTTRFGTNNSLTFTDITVTCTGSYTLKRTAVVNGQTLTLNGTVTDGQLTWSAATTGGGAPATFGFFRAQIRRSAHASNPCG